MGNSDPSCGFSCAISAEVLVRRSDVQVHVMSVGWITVVLQPQTTFHALKSSCPSKCPELAQSHETVICFEK